jgi:hypothetical protein
MTNYADISATLLSVCISEYNVGKLQVQQEGLDINSKRTFFGPRQWR